MKVLFLTHRLPYAPNRGDRIRAYHLLQAMAGFATVSVFSLVHDDEEARQAKDMPFAAEVATARVSRARSLLRGAWQVAASPEPLTHALLDAPAATATLERLVATDRPDLVVAFCSGMARFALEPPLNDVPLVVDLVDVDSEKWRGLSQRVAPPRTWILNREARSLEAFEREVAARARAVLVVNSREAAALRAIAPDAPVHVVENGVDVAAFSPPEPPTDSADVIFCGVMDYAPNVEGVVWFAEEVWPRVRAARPDARFVVVGANPTKAIRALASGQSVRVTGRVAAVQPLLWRSAVSVAPLRQAHGLQNKVLEALAAGLPVVATDAVVAGLPPGVDAGCLAANDENAFADAVIGLLARPGSERRTMAAASGVDRLTWPVQMASLQAILEKAADSRLDSPRRHEGVLAG